MKPKEYRDLLINGGFFPPPWNIYDHPEKTEGWIAFQQAMKEDPEYYLPPKPPRSLTIQPD